MSQDFDIQYYFNIVKRRWLLAAVISTIALAVTMVFAYVLPPVYRSEARILVESQRIPTGLAQATVTAAAAERIQVITQRLMTRDNLLNIAREFNLFPKSRENLSPSEIVEVMRDTTAIEPISTAPSRRGRDSQVIAFTVSFEYREAPSSSRVANRFVELILEQNIRSRTRRASDTRNFFDEQLTTRKSELRAKEQEIIDFKRANSNALPDSLEFRRQVLASSEREIEEIDARLEALRLEKEVITNRLRATGNTFVETAAGLSAKQEQLQKLELSLVQLKTLYSDSHPNVRRAKIQIEAIRKSIAADPAETPPPPQENTNTSDIVSPQLTLLNQQQESLEKRRQSLQTTVTSLSKAINRTPEVESALGALINDRETLEQQVRQLQIKIDLANTGERLEEDRQAERFEVIEQATTPNSPIKPNRIQIIAAGAFASLALGLGFAVLLELLDQTVRGRKDLISRFQVEPIVTIPYIKIPSETKYRKRKSILFMALIFTLVAMLLSAVHFFYTPLDIILLKTFIKIRTLVG